MAVLQFLSVLGLAAAIFLVIQGQPGPPGGRHPVSPDDPTLTPAINFAVASVNADCDNCMFCQVVVNVANATEQVVDGRVFRFRLGLQESDKCFANECMQSIPPSGSKCPPTDSAKAYWCDVQLVIKSWSAPTHFIQNLTCDFPPQPPPQ